MKKDFKIKPYARLITMLGDQLIKNEVIALIELIKNSYDADANFVKVDFVNFNDDFSINSDSKIIIEDDGCGMNVSILEEHWLNPATPVKLKRKKDKKTTGKGRILQGEKGIGRFAIFKLGRNIKLTTRRQKKDGNGNFINEGESLESVLTYNFSEYDDDFLSQNGKEKPLFLEDLKVVYEERKPELIINEDDGIISRKSYGTIIEISDLKSTWSVSKIAKIQKDVGKLQPIFAQDNKSDFSVLILKDGEIPEIVDDYKSKLFKLLEEKPVFKITNGKYFTKNNEIEFELNGELVKLNFADSEITGLSQFRNYFKTSDYKTDCGDFKFEFYVFDLNATSENYAKYYLDKEEKAIVKEHRIYLYRDGIRVMPYGDPEDDWLRIDIARGTISAGEFLSNDQVVGCVYITQDDNPKLKDKTNREGLIEDGNALQDFVNVLQLILRYIRVKPFAKYIVDKRNKVEFDLVRKGKPLKLIEDAKDRYKDNTDVSKFLQTFEKSYKNERKIFSERIAKTENLAAVGLSVETASHDVMLFMNKTFEQQDMLIRELSIGKDIDREDLINKLTLIRGNLSIIHTQLKDIQLLFPSTKSRTKLINVKEIVDKVHSLYMRPLAKNKIVCNINFTTKPLVVKTTDAVLLQVIINLFDNALYWLKNEAGKREISIDINGDENRLVFSDNGPGIREDDAPYVFEAFYSGKGEDGRGLGLYIARQLLDRYDYKIDLADFSRDKKLKGANFVLDFVREGNSNGN